MSNRRNQVTRLEVHRIKEVFVFSAASHIIFSAVVFTQREFEVLASYISGVNRELAWLPYLAYEILFCLGGLDLLCIRGFC